MGQFDNWVCHASSLGLIMTKPREKKNKLAQTAKTFLAAQYTEIVRGRKRDIRSKYLEKGTQVEQKAMTQYSLFTNEYYKSDRERITNEWITGEMDFKRYEENQGWDIKASWDAVGHDAKRIKPLDPIYEWQGQGYCLLFGLERVTFIHCLVDTPQYLIDLEIKNQGYGIDWKSDLDYQEFCKEIVHNMTFDDIPAEDKFIEFVVERNEDKIEQIPEKVIYSREFLNNFKSNIYEMDSEG